MARIEGEIVIARPVGEVFDYAADQRNEPDYNPRMARAEKVTSGPVGQGTVFRAEVRSLGWAAHMHEQRVSPWVTTSAGVSGNRLPGR